MDMEPGLWLRAERQPSGCLDQDMPPGGPLWGEQLHIHAAQRFPIQPQMDHAQRMVFSPLYHMLQIVERDNLCPVSGGFA